MLIDNTLKEMEVAAFLVAILERIGIWYLVVEVFGAAKPRPKFYDRSFCRMVND